MARPKLTPARIRTLHRTAEARFRAEREAGHEMRRAAQAERRRKAAEGAAMVRKAPVRPQATGPDPKHSLTLAWAKKSAARLKTDWHTAWTKVLAGNNTVWQMFKRETSV